MDSELKFWGSVILAVVVLGLSMGITSIVNSSITERCYINAGYTHVMLPGYSAPVWVKP